MPKKTDRFQAVHARLKRILRKYAGRSLKGRHDKSGQYVLMGPPTEKSRGRDLWFGAVRKGKSYVSYHLISVYAFPDLLDTVSPALKKRMQGKSCFNFCEPDDQLFSELDKLTASGYRRFKKEGYLR